MTPAPLRSWQLTRARFDALPDDTARALAQMMAQHDLTSLRAAFDETGAGLHALRAWRATRATALPLPEWVAEYIDRAAAAADDASTTAEAAQAFALAHPGGGPSRAPAQADEQMNARQSLRAIYESECARIGNGNATAPTSKADVLRRMAGEFAATLSGETEKQRIGALRQRLRRLGVKV